MHIQIVKAPSLWISILFWCVGLDKVMQSIWQLWIEPDIKMNQKSRFAFIHNRPLSRFFCITRQHYSSLNAKKKNCDMLDGNMRCMHHTSSHPQYCNQMILPTSKWPQVQKIGTCVAKGATCSTSHLQPTLIILVWKLG